MAVILQIPVYLVGNIKGSWFLPYAMDPALSDANQMVNGKWNQMVNGLTIGVEVDFPGGFNVLQSFDNADDIENISTWEPFDRGVIPNCDVQGNSLLVHDSMGLPSSPSA